MTDAHIPDETRRTSEQRYGIPRQPAETCPLINSVIDSVVEAVTDIRRAIRGFERADELDLREMIRDVERIVDSLYELQGKNSVLEKIRSSNGDIREWGQAWKELALEHAPAPEQVAA